MGRRRKHQPSFGILRIPRGVRVVDFALVAGREPKAARAMQRKLEMLNAATCTEHLKTPPSNNLEKLQGDRKGQMSIRVNRRYRVCFVWDGSNASDVEIVDYH